MLCPAIDVVAGIDAAPRHDAVDLRHHVAVAEVQLGLVEIGLRLGRFGLGLLHGRRVLEDLREDAVDVALRIPLVEIGEHLLGRGVERIDHTELRRGLHEASLRLLHPGERLVQVGRNLGEVIAVRGFARQPESGADFVDVFPCLVQLCLGHREGLRVGVELLLRHGPLFDQRPFPIVVGPGSGQRRLLGLQRRDSGAQLGDLVVEVLDGVRQAEPLAARQPREPAHLRLRGDEVGLGGRNGGAGDVDLELVRLPVQLDEQVALVHAIVVVDEDTRHLAGNARRDERDVSVHEGIVRGDRIPSGDDPGDAGDQEQESEDAGDRPAPAPPAGPAPLGRLRCRGLCGCRDTACVRCALDCRHGCRTLPRGTSRWRGRRPVRRPSILERSAPCFVADAAIACPPWIRSRPVLPLLGSCIRANPRRGENDRDRRSSRRGKSRSREPWVP